MIDKGKSIIHIRRQLGRTKTSTALEIYSHLSKNETLGAAKKRGSTIVGQLDIGSSKMVAK